MAGGCAAAVATAAAATFAAALAGAVLVHFIVKVAAAAEALLKSFSCWTPQAATDTFCDVAAADVCGTVWVCASSC